MSDILFLLLYFECYFCTSDAIATHFAKCCCGKYKITRSTMAEEVKTGLKNADLFNKS